MYGQFEQLEGNPFASARDRETFVPITAHREVLNDLTYWLREMNGVGMLTAGPGLGKSHLCCQLKSLAGEETLSVMVSQSQFHSKRELLQSILYLCERPFEEKDEHELSLELLGFIRELGRANRTFLLIVDDAHELTEELMLELRALTVHQGESTPPIRLLLSGQLELEELLTRRSLSAINQILTTHQILEPWTREESAEYLAGRLSAVNCEIETVLSEGAVESIVHVSDGVPRCLNQIAEAAFRECVDRKLDLVTSECVRAAFEKVRHLPQHWNDLPELSEESSIESDSEILTETDLSDTPLASDSDIFETALDDSGHDAFEDDSPTEPADAVEIVEEPSELSIEIGEAAEEEEIEYVVAEFGSGVEDREQTEISHHPAQTPSHFSSPKLAYAQDRQDVTNVRKTTPVGRTNEGNNSGSSESTLELVSSIPQTEELEVSSEAALELPSDENNASEHGKKVMSEQTSNGTAETPASSSRYLRIDTNPIDIFAPDIPQPGETTKSSESTRVMRAVGKSGEHGTSIEEHVERLRQEAIKHWEPSDPKQDGQYDVIEPESIPAVPKARPSLELDLPNRQSKPRYRNLFRDLRRNR